MTKVLREANSPGRDKGNLGLLSGSCQIPRSQALDRICNRQKAAKHKGKADEKERDTTKGSRGRGGWEQKADSDMPFRAEEWGIGEMPRGLLHRVPGLATQGCYF